MRVRCAAGRSADPKAHAGGLHKLKGFAGTDLVERQGRRMLREGKFVLAEDGKKGKEAGYWLFDDCLAWGSKGGGSAKGWLKLATCKATKTGEGEPAQRFPMRR